VGRTVPYLRYLTCLLGYYMHSGMLLGRPLCHCVCDTDTGGQVIPSMPTGSQSRHGRPRQACPVIPSAEQASGIFEECEVEVFVSEVSTVRYVQEWKSDGSALRGLRLAIRILEVSVSDTVECPQSYAVRRCGVASNQG
jgi:hypothetical protein